MSKQRLELTWIGKNNPEYDVANIEPRILEENPKLSYGDKNTENMVIHGDNLLALKALLPEYEGKIKCIYIDPPYNTGNAFEHYDDSVEHSTWLSLMKPRLELLRDLLSENGIIFISIDDNELCYLKVLMDEIFGRVNFVTNLIWKKKRKASNLDKQVRTLHEYILVYAKNRRNRTEGLSFFEDKPEENKPYPFYNSGNTRGKLKFPANFVKVSSMADGTIKAGTFLDNKTSVDLLNDIDILNGTVINEFTLIGEWRYSQASLDKFADNNEIVVIKGSKLKPYWINNSDRKKYIKTLLSEYETIGTNEDSEKEIFDIFGSKAFDFPKPESLIRALVDSSTDVNDIVLDSFLGSGTTAAVAHKMGRRYIGIEMGEQAYTHVQKRLVKVINGTDNLKLSEELKWEGGGGFKYFELAPSFITTDEHGNPVIDEFYNENKLIKAMCKIMGYTFKPSPTNYWNHGFGQGKNYIFVTTQMVSVGTVQQIASQLGNGETLLICPKKYEPGAENIDDRITIKKIPQSVLKACHFGKKEYLLPINEATAIEEIEYEDEDE